jgi:HD-like signal output (HDOD) protein
MTLTLQTVLETQIASPPGVYFKLREVIDDPKGTFDQITEIINGDPGMAARLLKIANSAFYGLSAKVETISHALNIIGSDHLSEMALATSMINRFKGIPKNRVNVDQFWKHSVACGVAARHIALHKNFEHPESYYLAGILHDLGKLILLKEIPEDYGKVLAMVREDDSLRLMDVETRILKFNHAQLGSILLKEWKLPPNLFAAVNFHHDPLKARDYVTEASVIHVADYLAYKIGLTDGCESTSPHFVPETLTDLELNVEFMKEAKLTVEKHTEQIVKAFTAKN